MEERIRSSFIPDCRQPQGEGRDHTKKMQSEMADFAQVPPPGEVDETCASSLIHKIKPPLMSGNNHLTYTCRFTWKLAVRPVRVWLGS